jgi:hypothetical protein
MLSGLESGSASLAFTSLQHFYFYQPAFEGLNSEINYKKIGKRQPCRTCKVCGLPFNFTPFFVLEMALSNTKG